MVAITAGKTTFSPTATTPWPTNESAGQNPISLRFGYAARNPRVG